MSGATSKIWWAYSEQITSNPLSVDELDNLGGDGWELCGIEEGAAHNPVLKRSVPVMRYIFKKQTITKSS